MEEDVLNDKEAVTQDHHSSIPLESSPRGSKAHLEVSG
jgi:hypothetical protein